MSVPEDRLGVRKTYKLFIGGAFPRSESGRSYPVTGPDGALLAHGALASPKGAKGARSSSRQNSSRRLGFRPGRRNQWWRARSTGGAGTRAGRTRSGRWTGRPTRWPGRTSTRACPSRPAWGRGPGLRALVSVLPPVIAIGNTVVLVASETAPLAAVSLAEVLATSDVPGGVVNVLTGRSAELAPVLAAHMDVNAIDLTGAAPVDRAELERLAAGNVKRVFAAGA